MPLSVWQLTSCYEERVLIIMLMVFWEAFCLEGIFGVRFGSRFIWFKGRVMLMKVLFEGEAQQHRKQYIDHFQKT